MIKTPRNSFTLIELLVSICVVGILATITLGAAKGVQDKAARSRAGAEIAALSTALESYKIDNGVYPYTNSMPKASGSSDTDPTTAPYKNAARALFTELGGGRTTFEVKGKVNGVVYMPFRRNQVKQDAAGDYVIDPYRNPYGYAADSGTVVNAVMNPGFFDLWSTCGKTGSKDRDTNYWKTNWRAD